MAWRTNRIACATVAGLALSTLVAGKAAPALASPTPAAADDTYSYEEVLDAGKQFFGATSEGLATIVKTVFDDLGRPNAMITGSDAAAAFVVGLRYGSGTLKRKKTGRPTKVYWTGPSAGFDFGGSGSQAFILVYNLGETSALFRRFPGAEGAFFFVAGLGVNYYQLGDTVLAPIRSGVGLRYGVSAGYLHFTRTRKWVPF